MSRKPRLSKEEALSFLLTHLVVERAYKFEMTPTILFRLNHMATESLDILAREEGAIPHEVIENIAQNFIDKESL